MSEPATLLELLPRRQSPGLRPSSTSYTLYAKHAYSSPPRQSKHVFLPLLLLLGCLFPSFPFAHGLGGRIIGRRPTEGSIIHSIECSKIRGHGAMSWSGLLAPKRAGMIFLQCVCRHPPRLPPPCPCLTHLSLPFPPTGLPTHIFHQPDERTTPSKGGGETVPKCLHGTPEIELNK